MKFTMSVHSTTAEPRISSSWFEIRLFDLNHNSNKNLDTKWLVDLASPGKFQSKDTLTNNQFCVHWHYLYQPYFHVALARLHRRIKLIHRLHFEMQTLTSKCIALSGVGYEYFFVSYWCQLITKWWELLYFVLIQKHITETGN